MASISYENRTTEEILCDACDDNDLFTVQKIVDAGLPISQETLNRAASTAAHSEDAQVLRFLLERGASVNGRQLLPGACNKLEMLQAMYDYGWHAEQINQDMKEYPYMQIIVSNVPILEWLLEHGMDPNLPGDRRTDPIRGHLTPLNAAAFRGRFTEDAVNSLKLLVSRGAVLDPFVLENAIGLDVRGGRRYSRKVVQWLVGHGADVNYRMQSGATLLYAAVEAENFELVTTLLELGADASERDPRSGMTPLERARAQGLEEIGDVIDYSEDLIGGKSSYVGLSRLDIKLAVAV
ncbi:ankyrin repeat-containing domain protein [Hypoxylon trugodes]|uniref:ankyrin repeat-containing domain protein n=1 Tax=Hypoxylon trugodes TaxID=326681 RepID=UPI0021931CED|nr:ankyrin repeat-containing domain protein [Hypoxylon trugodes]KAI1385616.1 ankyrin repeat-containing domain protein [Hypoxylon trugodes]